MHLSYHKNFVKDYRALAIIFQKSTDKAIQLFQQDPRHPSLNFEQSAKKNGMYSIRLTRGHRILLRKISDIEFMAMHVGGHDIYRLYF